MAGTLAIPAGRAVPIDGGYRVSGRWPFASGCHNATWLACSAVVHDGERPRLDADGLPVMRVVVFPRSETIIHDTWYAGGLRGTGSHDVEIRDLVVPEACTFWWDRPAHPGPLYKARWYLMMHASHACEIQSVEAAGACGPALAVGGCTSSVQGWRYGISRSHPAMTAPLLA